MHFDVGIFFYFLVTALEFVLTPSPLIQETLLIDALWDFIGDPAVKTACSQGGDLNLITDRGTKIPHALHDVAKKKDTFCSFLVCVLVTK